jgi:hypothetical protein
VLALGPRSAGWPTDTRKSEPFFLGSALAAYQRRHGLDDDGLAAVLGCDPAVLAQLRLCRRPGAAEPTSTAEGDVARIAARFGLDAVALFWIVQETAPAP